MTQQRIFKTYKPQNKTISEFIEYYYIHWDSENTKTEFVGFPHTNTTLSLYPSHVRKPIQETHYDPLATFLQSFTPIRDTILVSRLFGKINKITIVFKALGIQQFYRDIDTTKHINDYSFFTTEELQLLFTNNNFEHIVPLLDKFLSKRYQRFTQDIISFSIEYISTHVADFNVEQLSKKTGFSRRHLNRLFKQHLGVSIKKFHEIIVFRSILNSKQFEKNNLNFTQLAHHINLSDQSHLNKIFENMTSQSPTSFFKKGIHLGDEDTFWHLDSE